jgi:hypothetical protein
MPYVKGHGRTAMSNLWERAAMSQVLLRLTRTSASRPSNCGFTKKFRVGMLKEVALAMTGREISFIAAPGSSPMAPRFSKPRLKNCRPFPGEDKPAKNRKRNRRKKKQSLKNEDPKPSSVALNRATASAGSTPIFLRPAHIFRHCPRRKIKVIIGFAMQPAVVLDFIFKLARNPARIAKASMTFPGRYPWQWPAGFQRGGQRNFVIDGQAGFVGKVIGAVQDKAAEIARPGRQREPACSELAAQARTSSGGTIFS